MSKYFEATKKALEKEELAYTEISDNEIGVGFTRENNTRLTFKFSFDENHEDDKNNDGEKYMHLGSYIQNANVKKNYAQALDLCNSLNREYRWVKFYVDGDYDISVDTDAILSEENAGDHSIELMFRMMSIIEAAEPRIRQLVPLPESEEGGSSGSMLS